MTQEEYKKITISIHALLAESDQASQDFLNDLYEFLSTLSLRRATIDAVILAADLRDFYPRSPCGERRGDFPGLYPPTRFLSTLSLRRATNILEQYA